MKNYKIQEDVEFYTKNNEVWKTLLRGVQTAINCYENSIRHNYDYIVINDGWESDAEIIVNYLRNSGVKNFIFDDTSTEATRMLKKFVRCGCKVVDVIIYQNDEYDKRDGLLIEL